MENRRATSTAKLSNEKNEHEGSEKLLKRNTVIEQNINYDLDDEVFEKEPIYENLKFKKFG